MTLDLVKEFVKKNVNVVHIFKFKGIRNQNEKFIGMITEIYPVIFIITLCDGGKKSFTYSDLLTNMLEVCS